MNDARPDPPAPARKATGFTDGSVVRHLVRLGSYMAMGSISMNVAQLAEAVYLGIVGTEALAAMGFAFPITITLFAFAGGVGTGASSVIARVAGAGDREAAALLVTHAQILSVLIGVAIGGLAIAFADEIVSTLGATGVVQDMTTDYLRVYLLGFPFFMLAIVGSTLLRATGSAASPGIVMTAGSVVQIALGPLLIFGLFGLPELGIAGAAWAYVLSRVIAVGLYGVMLVRTKMMRFSTRNILASWRSILHVGGPAIASGLVQPFSMLIITRLLAGHGHEVVAGYNVASRVETMAHMILWSASSSAEPFIGQNWGARQVERVREALLIVNRFCLAWGVVTFVLMMLIGGFVVTLIDDDPIVYDVATQFFLIIPLSIGFMGMMQVASSSFNARGLPGPPFVISLFRTLILGVPLAILGDWLWGYTGIFIATAVTNVGVGLAAWWWNRASVESHARQLGLAAGV